MKRKGLIFIKQSNTKGTLSLVLTAQFHTENQWFSLAEQPCAQQTKSLILTLQLQTQNQGFVPTKHPPTQGTKALNLTDRAHVGKQLFCYLGAA